MRSCLIIRYGEIGLKKGNRKLFEQRLLDNLLRALNKYPEVRPRIISGRILLEHIPDPLRMAGLCAKVMGVVSVRPSNAIPSNMDQILSTLLSLAEKLPVKNSACRFAVKVHRAYKGFPGTNPEIARVAGSALLKKFPHWEVDLTAPQLRFVVEIHKDATYISTAEFNGPGGLPVGSAGKVVLLLSGGIDSPVAGYLMQKRGALILPVYFHSFPHTSDHALKKVIDLAGILGNNQRRMSLHKIPFTKIQESIRDNCSSKNGIILHRRMMMRICNTVAAGVGAGAIVTGESLGQVASQTLENMSAINEAAQIPVLRPLIAYDKTEIVSIARTIGTYDISIRPYDDCCSLFVDPHPVTRANLRRIKNDETKLPVTELVNEALAEIQKINLAHPDLLSKHSAVV